MLFFCQSLKFFSHLSMLCSHRTILFSNCPAFTYPAYLSPTTRRLCLLSEKENGIGKSSGGCLQRNINVTVPYQLHEYLTPTGISPSCPGLLRQYRRYFRLARPYDWTGVSLYPAVCPRPAGCNPGSLSMDISRSPEQMRQSQTKFL